MGDFEGIRGMLFALLARSLPCSSCFQTSESIGTNVFHWLFLPKNIQLGNGINCPHNRQGSGPRWATGDVDDEIQGFRGLSP